MKPLIAVLPNVKDDGTVSIFDAYIQAIEKAGGLPFVVPYTESVESIYQYLGMCHGVLLTGGGDVSPTLYGIPSAEPMPRRDRFEMNFIKAALDKEKPIMAICRGLQIINVYFGGTLIEDIAKDINGSICHRHPEEIGDVLHSIRVDKGSPLAELFGSDDITVNSFHHQAIGSIGEGLSPMAYADDGIVEAVWAPGERYVRAFQWHPERIMGKFSYHLSLFKDFIRECEKQV